MYVLKQHTNDEYFVVMTGFGTALSHSLESREAVIL